MPDPTGNSIQQPPPQPRSLASTTSIITPSSVAAPPAQPSVVVRARAGIASSPSREAARRHMSQRLTFTRPLRGGNASSNTNFNRTANPIIDPSTQEGQGSALWHTLSLSMRNVQDHQPLPTSDSANLPPPLATTNNNSAMGPPNIRQFAERLVALPHFRARSFPSNSTQSSSSNNLLPPTQQHPRPSSSASTYSSSSSSSSHQFAFDQQHAYDFNTQLSSRNNSKPYPPPPTKSSVPPQFEDMFKCYICFDNLTRPVMCPHCSKIGCESCVMKWLLQERHQCPHCRSPLNSVHLIHCRFMDDLAQQLMTVVSSSEKNQPTAGGQCPVHSVPLYYYCHDCGDALCSDCAVMDQKHKDHRFEHLHGVYQTHRESIDKATKSLSEKVFQMDELAKQATDRISAINAAKLEIQQHHRTLALEADGNVAEQAAAQNELISEFLKQLNDEGDSVRKTVDTLKNYLDNASQIDLIKGSRKLVDLVNERHAESGAKSSLKLPETTTDFSSTLIPNYETSTFRIIDFGKLKESGEVILSPPFLASGLTWRLKVYCLGNGQAKGHYLSVFVELTHGYTPARYHYKVELVRLGSPQAGQTPLIVSREFSSNFEVGECWGYNRFFRLASLKQQGFWDEDKDCIELRFSVKAHTMHQKCLDLSMYAAALEQKLKMQSSVKFENVGGPKEGEVPAVQEPETLTSPPKPAQSDESKLPLSVALAAEVDLQPSTGATDSSITARNTQDPGADRDQSPSLGRSIPQDSASEDTGSAYNPLNYGIAAVTGSNFRPTTSQSIYVASLVTTRSPSSPSTEQTTNIISSSLDQLRNDMEEFEDFVDSVSREVNLLENRVRLIGEATAVAEPSIPTHAAPHQPIQTRAADSSPVRNVLNESSDDEYASADEDRDSTLNIAQFSAHPTNYYTPTSDFFNDDEDDDTSDEDYEDFRRDIRRDIGRRRPVSSAEQFLLRIDPRRNGGANRGLRRALPPISPSTRASWAEEHRTLSLPSRFADTATTDSDGGSETQTQPYINRARGVSDSPSFNGSEVSRTSNDFAEVASLCARIAGMHGNEL